MSQTRSADSRYEHASPARAPGFARVFTIDLRSLAAFRIAVSIILLWDLANRVAFLPEHYLDGAILSPEQIAAITGWSSPLDLHRLSGNTGWVGSLFALQFLLCAALALGWRTRTAAVGSWLLLTSLHFRQPYLLYGADHLLRLSLFFGMFLPLGARFSVDSRSSDGHSDPPRSHAHVSVAGAALLLQIAFVYFFTGIAKSGDAWLNGEALGIVLADSEWVRAPAAGLLALPELLPSLTHGVLALEILGPIVLLATWRSPLARGVAIVSLFLMHLGSALTMHIGVWGVLGMAAVLVFLPAAFWQRLPGSLSCESAVGAGSDPEPASRRTTLAWARDTIVGVSIVWIAWFNAGHYFRVPHMPQAVERLGDALNLTQRWNMFAPNPRMHHMIWEAFGTTPSRRTFRLAGPERGPRWQRVAALRSDFRFKTFRFLFRNHDPSERLAGAYAAWLCDQWNAEADADHRLGVLRLVALLRPIGAGPDEGHWNGHWYQARRCGANGHPVPAGPPPSPSLTGS